MSRRRLYIPITRSGSSILASITTQLLQEGSRLHHENQPPTFCNQYPNFCFWTSAFGIVFGFIIYTMVMGTLARIFGDWWAGKEAAWLSIGLIVGVGFCIRSYVHEKEREYWDNLLEEQRKLSDRIHAEMDAKRRAGK